MRQYAFFAPVCALLCCAALLLAPERTAAQMFDEEYPRLVRRFQALLKAGDKVRLSQLFFYPFERPYPIPDIQNAREFLDRYEQLIDENLRREILTSPPENWSFSNSSGLLELNDRLVGMGEEGFIYSFNYVSPREDRYYRALLKKKLHPSLHGFKSPEAYVETPSFKIHIDLMPDETYRYAVWSRHKPTTARPDLVITGGKMDLSGTRDFPRYQYTFINQRYKYHVTWEPGGERPRYTTLYVSQDKRLILGEKAVFADR